MKKYGSVLAIFHFKMVMTCKLLVLVHFESFASSNLLQNRTPMNRPSTFRQMYDSHRTINRTINYWRERTYKFIYTWFKIQFQHEKKMNLTVLYFMTSISLLKMIVPSIAAGTNLATCPDTLINSNINCHILEFLVESQVWVITNDSLAMTYNNLHQAFSGEQFEKTNGYSNEYWGWGGEDDDLFMRTYGSPSKRVFRPNKSVYRFRMIHHTKEKTNQPNPKRFLILKSWKYHWKNDGLSVSWPHMTWRDLTPLELTATLRISTTIQSIGKMKNSLLISQWTHFTVKECPTSYWYPQW